MLGVKNGIMTALSPTIPVSAAQHFERVITANRISDAAGHREQGMRHFEPSCMQQDARFTAKSRLGTIHFGVSPAPRISVYLVKPRLVHGVLGSNRAREGGGRMQTLAWTASASATVRALWLCVRHSG